MKHGRTKVQGAVPAGAGTGDWSIPGRERRKALRKVIAVAGSSRMAHVAKSVGAASQKTRLDTRLPKVRADGQGLYLRSLDHLGRSSEAKDRKKQKKVKCDRLKDQQMDGPTDRQSGV